jgi:hypothetical protein
MKCSTEEAPLEVTEDCWVPPPVSQSFVACMWGSHSLHPDASSLPHCQVKWLCLWPNKASECSICRHARTQLMPPDLPKQDYWNQRAIASLANTLITVVEPVPMPLLSSMLLLQL